MWWPGLSALLFLCVTGSTKLDGKSLVIVLDCTTSMTEELQQVKDSIRDIVNVSIAVDKSIHDLVFVKFSDPLIEEFVSDDIEEIMQEVGSSSVVANERNRDCQENSIEALVRALQSSRPMSYVYVVTDAGAKDYRFYKNVTELVAETGSEVVFLLTGRCHRETHNSISVYYNIARISNGQVFNISKADMKEILQYVKAQIATKNLTTLSYVDKPDASSTLVTFEVDRQIDMLMITGAGSNITITLTDPQNVTQTLNTYINLSSAISGSPERVIPGTWTANVSSSTAYSTKVTASSPLDFHIGFSIIMTENMEETSPAPVADMDNYILIKAVGSQSNITLDYLRILDVGGNFVTEMSVENVAGQQFLYKTFFGKPQGGYFRLQIIGRDDSNTTISRITRLAIIGRKPDLPHVSMDAEQTAEVFKPFTLMCRVKSVVAFTAVWFKDNVELKSNTSYIYSRLVELRLDNVTEASQGIYTCKATNILGSAAKNTSLVVTGAAPLIDMSDRLDVMVGRPANLECHVTSALSYNITWTRPASPADSGKDISAKTAEQSEGAELKMVAVGKADEGWYECTAASKGGTSKRRVYLAVRQPLQVTVSPALEFQASSSFSLHCRASGEPPIHITWKKDGEELNAASEHISVTASADTANLTVSAALPEDEGTYSCWANTSHEGRSQHVTVSYVEQPSVRALNSNIDIKSGQTVTLNVTITGIPKPNVTWNKDDEGMSPSSRLVLHPNGALSIESVDTSDSGMYTCTATNRLSSHSAKISLQVGTVPTLVHFSGDVHVDVLKSTTLMCRAEGIPKPEVKWSRRDGQAVGGTTTEDGILVIQDADVSDGGTYVCTARNKHGKVEKEANVTVSGLVAPEINTTVSEVMGNVGKALEVACHVLKGIPSPHISWLRNGEKLNESSSVLKYSKVEKAHQGSHKCIASNVVGSADHSILVKVTAPPVAHMSRTHTASVNTPTQLNCHVECEDAFSVSWTKDGKILSGTQHYTGTRIATMELGHLTESSEGNYTCQAANSAGGSEAWTILSVTGAAPLIDMSDRLDVMVGRPANLECHVTSALSYNITWTRPASPADSGKDISAKTAEQSEGAELKMVAVGKADEGWYECTAASKGGTSKRRVYLAVRQPLQVTVSPALEFQASSSFSLHCRASGEPPIHITWKKDGEELNAASEHISVTASADTANLTVSAALPEDEGTYSCWANTSHEGRSQHVTVSYVEQPSVRALNSNIDIKSGQTVTLNVTITGIPKPNVTWNKDDEGMSPSSRLVLHPNGALSIESVDTSDSGMYTCTATNRLSSHSAKISLQVGTVPTLVHFSGDVHVDVLKSTTLMCRAEGIPKPEVKWSRRDGQAVGGTTTEDGILVIQDADVSDGGTYVCTARNKHGKVEKEANVTVSGLVAPEINTTVSEVMGNVGKALEVACHVLKGIPSPHISWLRNGEKLNESSSVLKYSKVEKAHQGSHKCIASNVVGSADHSILVKVTAPPVAHMSRTHTASVNTPTQLNCHVECEDAFSVSWTKDGKILSGTQHYTGTRIATMELGHLTESSEGNYTCQAANSAGGSEAWTILSVTGAAPLIDMSDRLDVMVGRPANLECHVTSALSYNITWTRPASPADSGKDISAKTAEQSEGAELKMVAVGKADEGWYECTAASKGGTSKRRVYLAVRQPLQVTVSPALEFQASSSFSLHCRASGEPPIHITWKKDGEELNAASEHISVTASADTANLTVSAALPEDEGTYSCWANTSHEGRSQHVTVSYVEQPSVRALNSNIDIKSGQTVTLNVTITGIPKPNVTWNKDDEGMSPSSRLVLHPNGALSIESVDTSDSGMYTCTATNRLSSHSAKISLQVGTVPTLVHFSGDVHVDVLKSTTLMCRAEGIPKPEVKWSRRDGQAVGGTTTEDGILVIQDADVSDGGTYVCTARNKHGKVEKEANVTVSGLEMPGLKPFSGGRVLIVENQMLTLECEVVKGTPRPSVVWYQDGENVNGPGMKLHDYILVIASTKLENAGTYECIASNAAGCASQSVEIEVAVAPRTDNESAEIYEVEEGKKLDVECAGTGLPLPKTTWRKVGPHAPLNTARLLIQHVQLEDNGTYECRVENVAGVSVKIIHLFVHFMPRVQLLPSTRNPSPGDKVTLACLVRAPLGSGIMWFKDGTLLRTKYNHRHLNDSYSSVELSFNATLDSSGVYVCRVNSGKVSLQRNITLDIKVSLTSRFMPWNVVEIIKGHQKTLSCAVFGHPQPNVVWYPGKQSSRNLRVTPEMLSKTNNYYCIASNEYESMNISFTIKQIVRPQVINAQPENNYSMAMGETLYIRCRVEGPSAYNMSLMKDGKELQRKENDGTRTGMLLYKTSVTKNDAGIYSCIAYNKAGQHTLNRYIYLKEKPEMDSQEDNTVYLEKRQRLRLYCPIVNGYPRPIVMWFKNGIYRETSTNYTYTVNNANVADEGHYTCIAKNDVGDANFTFIVTVLEKPSLSVRKKVKSQEGETATLTCQVTNIRRGQEPNITWWKEKHLIEQGLSPRLSISPGGNSLTITHTRISDSGKYICRAVNRAGGAQKEIQLNIVKPSGGGRNTVVHNHMGNNTEGKSLSNHLETLGKERVKAWGPWNEWSSWSSSCSLAHRYRRRQCQSKERCMGQAEMVQKQHSDKICPIHGGWTEWSEYEQHEGTCGYVRCKRTRECTKPKPDYEGNECVGDFQEISHCQLPPCRVDGGWSAWGSWGSCSTTCGLATRQRTRLCNNPWPQGGGIGCIGQKTDEEACSYKSCDASPRNTFMNVQGEVNGRHLHHDIQVTITDLPFERMITATVRNIYRSQVPWFSLIIFLLAPITWISAMPIDLATNGYTLTGGDFTSQSHVDIGSGYRLQVLHQTKTDTPAAVHVDIHVQGNIPQMVPAVPPNHVISYQENYVQMTSDTLYAASLNTNGLRNVSWYTMVHYSGKKRMNYCAQRLFAGDIKISSPDLSQIVCSLTATIEKKYESDICGSGFKYVNKYCQDNDECASGTHDCLPPKRCVNSLGSYKCECPAGYTASGSHAACEDIDECTDIPKVCSHHCKNLRGSFQCLCPPQMHLKHDKSTCAYDSSIHMCQHGFRYHSGQCQDVDECRVNRTACLQGETCVNTFGSYVCFNTSCPLGFFRDTSTRNCIKKCNSPGAKCDDGATRTHTVKHQFLAVYHDVIQASSHLLQLNTESGNNQTRFRIEHNLPGKPLRIKGHNGIGTVYTLEDLDKSKLLSGQSISFLALTYDNSGTVLYDKTTIIVIMYPEIW